MRRGGAQTSSKYKTYDIMVHPLWVKLRNNNKYILISFNLKVLFSNVLGKRETQYFLLRNEQINNEISFVVITLLPWKKYKICFLFYIRLSYYPQQLKLVFTQERTNKSKFLIFYTSNTAEFDFWLNITMSLNNVIRPFSI